MMKVVNTMLCEHSMIVESITGETQLSRMEVLSIFLMIIPLQ